MGATGDYEGTTKGSSNSSSSSSSQAQPRVLPLEPTRGPASVPSSHAPTAAAAAAELRKGLRQQGGGLGGGGGHAQSLSGHSPYHHGQQPGNFHVRSLTSTPQKGIRLRVEQKNHEGLPQVGSLPSALLLSICTPSMLLVKDFKKGAQGALAMAHTNLPLPDLTLQNQPQQQPHVLSKQVEGVGLSVPSRTWSFAASSSPAGGMLHQGSAQQRGLGFALLTWSLHLSRIVFGSQP